MGNYILLAPVTKDGVSYFTERVNMRRVLRKATMFCRITHLKDKPALTNGDTIRRVTLCDYVQRELDCKVELSPV